MDIICYSHLRWNFVYQRPQHIMSRLSSQYRIFYIEEPVFGSSSDYIETQQYEEHVYVCVPFLRDRVKEENREMIFENLVAQLVNDFHIKDFIEWYYTPMMYKVREWGTPSLLIYDCMDELSAFLFAPPELKRKERDLLSNADLVFTGGYSLFEAKKHQHQNIHLFPSSIDRQHFQKTTVLNPGTRDLDKIPYPRIGFCGVIDERMDLELLGEIAEKKPEWHFVMIGPVVKIDPASLPKHLNIHYLGQKSYQDLPGYISSWSVAIMPFAINQSTRFISPTKTPEYLAAGKPVVSTPIHDVVKGYGDKGLVYIASNADEFVHYIQKSLETGVTSEWLEAVNNELSSNSWDITCEKMMDRIELSFRNKSRLNRTQEVKHV